MRLLTLFAALALAGTPAAVSDAELLHRAEAAFRRGAAQRADPDRASKDFAEAARGYELLRRRGADNAELYRDLGNAHLLAGQLPEAILAYRRGLRCAPHDRELADGLAYARAQVHYGPEAVGQPTGDAWPAWLPRVDSGLFLLSAFLLYALACVAFTRAALAAEGRSLTRATLLLALAAAAAGLWAYVAWRARGDGQPLVVIARDGVALRRGNGPTYPANAVLPRVNAGMEARLRHRRGGWLQIELPGEVIGWIPESAALVDDP